MSLPVTRLQPPASILTLKGTYHFMILLKYGQLDIGDFGW